VLWIFLVVRILMDIFASDDMNGWAKACWLVLVVFLPLFGVLIYLIVRGRSMQDRQQQRIDAQEQAFNDSVKDAAGTSPAAELSKLADLHDRGVISDAELEREKDKILASSHGPRALRLAAVTGAPGTTFSVVPGQRLSCQASAGLPAAWLSLACHPSEDPSHIT
jgi:hypothetical protein